MALGSQSVFLTINVHVIIKIHKQQTREAQDKSSSCISGPSHHTASTYGTQRHNLISSSTNAQEQPKHWDINDDKGELKLKISGVLHWQWTFFSYPVLSQQPIPTSVLLPRPQNHPLIKSKPRKTKKPNQLPCRSADTPLLCFQCTGCPLNELFGT